MNASPLELPPLRQPGGGNHFWLCHLYYRPLREGDGEGDPAPWSVETFDDTDAVVAISRGSPGVVRAGRAHDELSELARGGGRWLAFVATSEWREFLPPQSVARICGEYVVRGGAVERLLTWRARWPVAWWERGTRTSLEMLCALGDLRPSQRAIAVAAWIQALADYAPSWPGTGGNIAEALDTIRAWGDRCRGAMSADDEAATAGLVQDALRLMPVVDERARNDPRGDAPPGREAWVAGWERASVAAVQRAVGDAWFIARATAHVLK